jgi:hypothetical protein
MLAWYQLLFYLFNLFPHWIFIALWHWHYWYPYFINEWPGANKVQYISEEQRFSSWWNLNSIAESVLLHDDEELKQGMNSGWKTYFQMFSLVFQLDV